MKSIVLMGIKHCGKSTQARMISEKLGCDSFDTDDVIAEMTGKTPREIYTESGEGEFKKAEVMACRKVCGDLSVSGKRAVIATGGGICNDPEAIEVLRKTGILVYLCADKNVATERVVREITVAPDGTLGNMPAYIAKKNPRTKADAESIFHEFYDAREKIYSSLADVRIELGTQTKVENRDKILRELSVLD